MQDQDVASSSQSQKKEPASPAKEMDTAADKDDAPNSSDLHRSVINSLAEVPKFSEEWFRLKEKEISLRLKSEDDEASSMHADETRPFSEPTTTADEDTPQSASKLGIERMPSTNDAPIPVGATMSEGGDDLDDKVFAKKAACAKPGLMHDDLGPNTSSLHNDSLSSNKKSPSAQMGIEQMPSTNDALIPPGATMSYGGDDLDDDLVAKKAACAKPELIHDDFGPDASLLHGDSLGSNKKSARSSLETIEDDSSCPLPFYCTKQDDMSIDRKVAESKLECDDESAYMERNVESRGDIEHAIIQEAPPTQQQPDTNPSESSRVSNFDDESIFHPPPEEADLEYEVTRSNAERSVNNGHLFDTHLVKAWAVDEGSDSEKSVYMAEEVVETPWWKQRRTKLLLAVLVMLVVLAITLGLVNSQDVATSSSFAVIRSQSPSMILTPTSWPSNAPSSSPTECIERMYSSMQRIDFEGEVDDWYSSVAVDGSNMVVVATGVIKFFSMTGEGVWERSNSFKAEIDAEWSSASLSGKTAFVGFYSAVGNLVRVYEINTIGEWEKVQDPFEVEYLVDPIGWGSEVDIDGDLACISDLWPQFETHILHRNGSKWIHLDTKNGSSCSIFEDTVEINVRWNENTTQKHLFKYNEIQNELSPIQDPISIQVCNNYYDLIKKYSVLSNEYLAIWNNCNAALDIYRRDPSSETYTLYQELNMKGVFHVGDAKKLRMDNDVLVIAGYNETFIFVDQDGTWVESASIVDGGFQALSDRNAIFASDGEVRAYSILEDCTQPIPTATPSFEPSAAPSTSPTYSSAPSVSLLPSSSSSPTQCVRQVQLDVLIDDPWGAIVAVDGRNLVVAAHDVFDGLNETAPVFIQFYSLESIGEWTMLNSSFQFDEEISDVVLSGNTTLVSFRYSPPLVLEQSSTGEWGIVSDPFTVGDNATKEWWVHSVDVEGDLACFDFVEGHSLFRRNDSKWTEVHYFPTSDECALTDGTIAVLEKENNDTQIQLYEYNQGQDSVLLIQDPIVLEAYASKLALSNDYLVYSRYDTVFVYKRNSVNQTYIFHQELEVTYYIPHLSLHENTLAVATYYYQTHIFVEQNGSWVEATVLDQDYKNVAVSGQNLIASTETEVHSYNLQNIEDCMAP